MLKDMKAGTIIMIMTRINSTIMGIINLLPAVSPAARICLFLASCASICSLFSSSIRTTNNDSLYTVFSKV